MRQEEQQVTNDHPEAVRSAPVAVPPPGDDAPHGDRPDRAGRADVPEDALDDRGTFDDPAVAGARDPDGEAADTDRAGRPEFHEPAPLPTAFGATTVSDAVAASAMASGRPEDERDPRGEDTARPGDGAPGRTDASTTSGPTRRPATGCTTPFNYYNRDQTGTAASEPPRAW
ncbi:hypothetical protein [Micromonospora sp. ATA51]|uniref:hypothetical protein n=1 Tax=Micromonospora sp. ATA51 TaxID=2806098 RepID=UPI001EE448F1|nr:hypothetical protein [Micromonospora sp. ATA51]